MIDSPRFATEEEAEKFIAAVQARDSLEVRYLFYHYAFPTIISWGDVLKELAPDDRVFADSCIRELEAQLDYEGCPV